MRHLLTDDEFEIVRRILERSAGLVHDETRRDSLAFSVVGRVEATGAASVPAYIGLISGPNGEAERQQLIDAVTIQETHFFRNPPQVRALRQHVLPELIRRCVAKDRVLTIWSAGCSTGEEPYSIAMLVRELLPMATREHVRIIGSDVSASAIAFARAGRYGARAVQMAEPADLARWFTADGEAYSVRDDVRELVEFRLHNLVTQPPVCEPGGVDLLLCRNVTIYFSRATTKALMTRFHESLSDGGYLFLGHSETLWQMSDAFTLVPLGDAFVYRRDDADRRLPIPDRRTEAGDPPILLQERRTRADRRKRASMTPNDGPSITLPPGQPLPSGWPALGAPRTAAPRPRSQPAAHRPASARADRAADAAAQLAEARAALAAGRYSDAVAAAARAAKADPLLVDPHLVSGEALVNLGRDADAIRELRQAVYLRPDLAPAHLLLAGALDRLGEPAAAGRAYRSAAATVADSSAEEIAVFFGGRSPAELVELCIRLAMQAERSARKHGMARGDER